MLQPTDINAPEEAVLAPDGGVPNSHLPALIYRSLPLDDDPAQGFEELFFRNGWTNAWRAGIYDYHHFHSTAHEVLGIATGEVRLRLGGGQGRTFHLRAGDVVVIPAGVAHRCEGATDLLVVGAYAEGRDWDTRKGDPEELTAVRANLGMLPLPQIDPVEGAGGPLTRIWPEAEASG